MHLVVDASVALKWFFQAQPGEDHLDDALKVLDALDRGDINLTQPPHFLAEMAAVLIREKGSAAYDELHDLRALDWVMLDDVSVYEQAMSLAATYRHHLFDTLYHATALQIPHARLLTADRRYYERASAAGQIDLLGATAPGRQR